jgi:hypothetical protein
MDTENYVTIMEAARQKGVTRQGVVDAIERGVLRSHVVFGRRVVCRDDVASWTPRNYGDARTRRKPAEAEETAE